MNYQNKLNTLTNYVKILFYFKYPKLHSLIFKQNAENYIFPLKT